MTGVGELLLFSFPYECLDTIYIVYGALMG